MWKGHPVEQTHEIPASAGFVRPGWEYCQERRPSGPGHAQSQAEVRDEQQMLVAVAVVGSFSRSRGLSAEFARSGPS